MLLDINFKPFTDTVRPENLTAHVSTNVFGYNPFKSYAKQPIKTTYNQPCLPGLEPELPKCFDKEELAKMDLPTLTNHLRELDTYYYEGPVSTEDYEDFTEIELVEQILEMYILIVEETSSSDLEHMLADLESYGVARSTLLTATEEQIRTWHANC